MIETVGSGLQGDNDGIFSQARFYRPQGLALDDDTLYVADTENHQVRVVDFQARIVHTVAGTGKQGAWSGDGGEALRLDLNSPWDLALKPGILIIAMAGPHQIWVVDLLHDQAYPYAGTGEEARKDGPVTTATFAQPSGLAIDGSTLYVADAEANIIRAVALPPANTVTTLAGGDLFEFGDVDGEGRQGAAAASARRGRARGPRLHRRHLQPQDQGARPEDRRGDDAGGNGAARATPMAPPPARSSSNPAGCRWPLRLARALAQGKTRRSTWPIPTTTPSARSTFRRKRCGPSPSRGWRRPSRGAI